MISKAERGGEEGLLNYECEVNKKAKSYSTEYSRLVSYGSTDWASTCLPTQIGRDGGSSGVYGRSCETGQVHRSSKK